MARAVAKPQNDVYTGMLITACVAMVLSVLFLIIESGEYDWMQKPTTTPSVNVPKLIPLPEAGAGVAGAAALPNFKREDYAEAPTPAPVVKPEPAKEKPAEVPPPEALPKLPVVKNEQPKPPVSTEPIPSPLTIPANRPLSEPETKPAAPTGPTPSPLTIPPSFQPTPVIPIRR